MALSDNITGPSDAHGKLIPVPYQHAGVLPEYIEQKLQAIVTTPQSPVDSIVQGMEVLYAGLKTTPEFPDELAVVLGNLAHQVFTYHWHGKSARALKIYGFCLRVLGEGSQPTEEDPEIDTVYAAPPAPPEEPEG